MTKADKERTRFRWRIGLELLDLAARDQFLLREFGRAIRTSERRIEEASEEWRAEQADYECEAIEGILGMSFVACQLDITSVVSRCQLLHGVGPELGPRPSKQDLMERWCEVVAGSRFSAITAINALANYFKHEDEWPLDWGKLKRGSPAAATASIVLALGVERGSSGNVRTGFERILGHSRFERVTELGELVRKWARDMKGEYKEKLKRKKLVLDA